jgi:hypothetical protein
MLKATILTTVVAFLFSFFVFKKTENTPLSISAMRTANDVVLPYKGVFGYGSNMGYYPPHSDEDVAELAANVGATCLRPALFEHFVDFWGYDVRLKAFERYAALGMRDNVCFLGYPSVKHKEKKLYCGKDSSALFANLYEPIWDKGENGTPVNEQNYYAAYVYKTVKMYGKWVKFWEIWNEPDYANTFKTEMATGLPGAWWNTNPDPCEYALHAPVQGYIRMLRISYEVIKSVDSTAYICTGGIGFPSFLDILLRQTDNPDGGNVTPQYPLRGGAYFDVVSYHAYPHIDNSVREWSDKITGFQYFRHSDRAAEGVFKRKNQYDDVLKKHGYEGQKFPKKHFIITECNLPARENGEFMGSYEAQRNFTIKAYVKAQLHGLLQYHVFNLSEIGKTYAHGNEFDAMGLYHPIENQPKSQAKPTESGIALRTMSQILRGSFLDFSETQRLQLPPNVDGAAFKNSTTGALTYCLWARTATDRSEQATATYSFPAALKLSKLEMLNWQYSATQQAQTVGNQMIKLTGAPCFLRRLK